MHRQIQMIERILIPLERFLWEAYGHDWYGERTFYGEAYMYVLARLTGQAELADRVIETYQKKYKEQVQYSWHHEFHWYAFAHLGEGEIDKLTNLLDHSWGQYPQNLRHKPTNWLLLRVLLTLRFSQHKANKTLAENSLRILLMLNQRRDGLILDRRLGRVLLGDKRSDYASHQYHIFMSVLLQEISALSGSKFIRNRSDRSVSYVLEKVLASQPDVIIPAGRGAHQVFGYASLVYLLAQRQETDSLQAVLAHLTMFQESDGSFPLVLIEETNNRNQFWESYNNLYDYLPFLAFCLRRALVLLASEAGPDRELLPNRKGANGIS